MNYELIKVISHKTLLNSSQIECAYHLDKGRALAPGIHAVVWPQGSGGQTYDSSAEFYGPFRSWKEAASCVRSLSEDGRQRPADRLVTVATVFSRWFEHAQHG